MVSALAITGGTGLCISLYSSSTESCSQLSSDAGFVQEVCTAGFTFAYGWTWVLSGSELLHGKLAGAFSVPAGTARSSQLCYKGRHLLSGIEAEDLKGYTGFRRSWGIRVTRQWPMKLKPASCALRPKALSRRMSTKWQSRY